MNALRFFLVDGKRMWKSCNLIYGILGIAMYMALVRLEDMKGDAVTYIVMGIMYVNSFVLVIMFAYEIFGNAIADDFKHKYIYQIVQRNNHLFFYTASKTFWIFVSSMLGTGLGVALYSLCLKINHVWADEYTDYLGNSSLGAIYNGKHYFIFLFLAGLQFGMLSGIMSMIGCLVSVIISNKWLAGSATVVGAYGFNLLGGVFKNEEVPFIGLFSVMHNLKSLGSGWMMRCFFMCILFYFIGTLLIYSRVQWRIINE